MCTINKSVHTKKSLETYLIILIITENNTLGEPNQRLDAWIKQSVPTKICAENGLADKIDNTYRWVIAEHLRKVKLATFIDGDLKAPFSIATTLRCRGGRYSIPRIALLYPWSIPYNCWVLSKEASSAIFFLIFGMTDLGLNPSLPDHWWMLYSLSLSYK